MIFDAEDPPEDLEKAKKDASGGIGEILRVGEERMVKAAARSQSGKILPGVPVTITIHEDDDEAITLEDGVLTAAGAGEATVRAESELAGIKGDLTVTVTKPIDKIVFSPDDSEYFLAAGESTGEITATAQDEDGNDITPRSDWSWESADDGVATVAKSMIPDPDDADEMIVKGIGQHASITGAGPGDTMIMATAEGVSGSVDVSVTGQSVTRVLRASRSSGGNVFTWDRGADLDMDETVDPAWTGDAASADGTTATTEFEVDIYDANSGERIEFTATTDITVSVSPSGATARAVSAATPVLAGGTLTITVTPPDGDSVIDAGGSEWDAGTHQSFITIRATGADPLKLRFAIVVVDAPEE